MEIMKRIRKKNIKRYNRNPIKCKNCKGLIPYDKRRNKFCSHSCAASVNNIGVTRNFNPNDYAVKYEKINKKKYIIKRTKIIRKCLYCGNPIERTSKKYCSLQCQQDFQWKEKKEYFEKYGKVKHDTESGYRKFYKRYLHEKQNHRCKICKRSKWMKSSILLILDHINGNAKDWSRKNLRLICSNCDATLPTYKGRNAGKGRHFRKMRYRQGKSY
jgi:endogenous inhibitor of DNA gyrase (YacG/DUF329 family)